MTDRPLAPFAFPGLPTRIRFGAGERYRLAEVIERAGWRRVLIVTTPRGAGLLREIDAVAPVATRAVFVGSRVHVPVETIGDARDVAVETDADGVIAIGGGSSIGLAKALAHYLQLPYVALPTTLSGSEMTSVWGETKDGHKRTARDETARPREVIYDPDLLATLPTDLAAQSAINALAHVAEAAYASDTSPLVHMLARSGADAISAGLVDLLDGGHGRFDRLLYGAALAGMCLSSAAMSIHHKICHIVGGAFDLPHAATHAIILPHALALNLPGSLVADELLASAFGTSRPEQRVQELLLQASAPIDLASLGAPKPELLALAPLVVEELGQPQANPVEVATDDVARLLARAWGGESAERSPQL